MNVEKETPRFVKRTSNPHFEDEGPVLVTGPPEYASQTRNPVQYVAVANPSGTVIGYLWFSDEDAAARWIPRRVAPEEGGVWIGRLRDAKARGLRPSEALAEAIRDSPASSHVVPDSAAEAPNSDAVRGLAGWPPPESPWHPATGTLLGLALGDAMGYPTEFLNMEQITSKFGVWRKMEMPLSWGDTVRVTDDTQMALAVGEALAEVTRSPRETGGAWGAAQAITPAQVESALRKHFVAWLHSPDNNRAPGQTCLDACAALERDIPWQAASILHSKGCGANMRVAPVALVPGLTAEQRSGIAQLQAALTHGHPTALAASDLTAHAVWLLAHGCALDDLLPQLRTHAQQSRQTYHSDWLGDLAHRAGAPDPASYIAFGWDECLRALDTVTNALRDPDMDQDPSQAVGAGWIAEEALATALYCFLVVGGDARGAIARGAHSSGDSDSIAALAGAFAGAAHGPKYWLHEWVTVLEYRDRIRALGSTWD